QLRKARARGCCKVCIGGGEILPDANDANSLSPIHAHALTLTGKERPRVCFVPTASGDSPEYVAHVEKAFGGRSEFSVLPLFKHDGRDVRKHLLAQDFIYAGGGSTANLLAIWRVHGLDRFMREAGDNGVLLGGISAGMLCWFECSLTDSFGGTKPLRDGLGFLQGSACPHYHGEAERVPGLRKAITGGELPTTFALDDGAAALFEDGRLVEIVTEDAGARGYRVSVSNEEQLDVRRLGVSQSRSP
ncbi:MAG: peptidase E, partial [Planctomycetota bacterium]